MRKKKMHRIPIYKVRIKMTNIIKKIKRKHKKKKLPHYHIIAGTKRLEKMQ